MYQIDEEASLAESAGDTPQRQNTKDAFQQHKKFTHLLNDIEFNDLDDEDEEEKEEEEEENV